MTKYYKQLNENSEAVALFTYNFTPNIVNSLVVEIAAEEYATLLAELTSQIKHELSTEELERRARQKEVSLKAKAYDIITGVAK